jgi:tetratricopeptide (TPR) repeat protein
MRTGLVGITAILFAAVALLSALGTSEAFAAEVVVRSIGPQEIGLTVVDGQSDPAPARLRAAYQLRCRGEPEQAALLYRELLEGDDPSGLRGRAVCGLGMCWLQMGARDRAVGMWKAAEQDPFADPNARAWARYSMAWLSAAEGRSTEALDLLQAVVRDGQATDTEVYAWAYYDIGRVQQQHLRLCAEARKAFAKVMEFYPNSKPARHRCWQVAD